MVEPSVRSFDNIRLDSDGRLWVGAGQDGAHSYAADGTLIGRTSSLYSLVMSVTGVPIVIDRR